MNISGGDTERYSAHVHLALAVSVSLLFDILLFFFFYKRHLFSSVEFDALFVGNAVHSVVVGVSWKL